MRVGTGFVALALALAVPAVAHAVTWRTYANERFGTTADVPSDWQAGEAPANGDGLRFTIDWFRERFERDAVRAKAPSALTA